METNTNNEAGLSSAADCEQRTDEGKEATYLQINRQIGEKNRSRVTNLGSC